MVEDPFLYRQDHLVQLGIFWLVVKIKASSLALQVTEHCCGVTHNVRCKDVFR